MKLETISYQEQNNTEVLWSISGATFSDINLIVGKNSSGKSRLVAIINSLSRILLGKHFPIETCQFSVTLRDAESFHAYEIEFADGGVKRERLTIDGVPRLIREEGIAGSIWYEKEQKNIEFSSPSNSVAAASRRDEVQHSFLSTLASWANSVAFYAFGTPFGREHFVGMSDFASLLRNPKLAANDDPNNLVGTYLAAFLRFGERLDAAIIRDMAQLGYKLTDVGSGDMKELIPGFPSSLACMYVVEADVGIRVPQIHISQGMFRALALVIHLNINTLSENKKTIIVDDIGEGLDFSRAMGIINLLMEKTHEDGNQLLMTSNDRFIMNEIPLKYWSLLKRDGRRVSVYNEHNAKKSFDQFKYIGLNNFDFFASDFIDGEASR